MMGELEPWHFHHLDHDRVYVSTNNGRFFYSSDGGESFTKGVSNVPGSHYLYGSTIVPSKMDANKVYLGGSGYSTAPVICSENGGKTFTAMRNGLPSTVVFQLALNEDETVLFAATEAGPYAYIFEDEEWYDISGIDAPNQTYWSVEFLKTQNAARFGNIWSWNLGF